MAGDRGVVVVIVRGGDRSADVAAGRVGDGDTVAGEDLGAGVDVA